VIAIGDLSGTLERAFERIAFETGEQLTFRMEMITLIATRVTSGAVMFVIAMLLLGLSSR
jgi:hypothetical protein